MGEGTESPRAEVLAARAEVVAARGRLDEELLRLEASARAAMDVKAKVKRNPVKAAGAAAGAGFVLVGGPKRVLRGARNAIFGKPDPLPKSMLPKEIDDSLRKLGDDGERVRGTIERDFARYLDEKAPERKQRDLVGVVGGLLLTVGRPIAVRYGKQIAQQLVTPDRASFEAQLEKLRSQRRKS
ncbi:MAG TPA: hypothetical protein VF770_03900 [Solirubrobacterales bacterium]